MENNKKRAILLSLLLLIILITGVFIIVKNKGNKENKHANQNETFQESKDNEEKEADKFHYVEEFVDEEIFEGSGYDKIFKYNGKAVRFKGDYLQDIKSKENIYKIPDNITLRGGYWLINEDEIWNVQYDSNIKKIIASSFDHKGNKKEKIELKDFKGHIADDSYIMVEHMKISDDYIYLSANTNQYPTLHIFTKEGELKYSYENVSSFDVDNKGRCIFTTQGSTSLPFGFYMVNSETGTEIFRNTSYRLNPIRFSEDGEFIYGFEKNLNVFHAKDGSFKELIFEFGRDSTYLLDDYDIKDFMVEKDGDIYYSLKTKVRRDTVIEFSDIKNFYYLYTKQEGERPKRETTVTITAPYRNDFMDEAIKRYELKYPDEHIEYNYTYNNENEFFENGKDSVSKLTLDIIQGNIGDIVHTGGTGIEIHNILATDAFMDLTDLIEKDKNYEYLNNGVLNALKINKAIRGLPLNYMFYQYELNEDLEKQLGLNIDFNSMSWSEVLDIVKLIEEKTPDRHLFTLEMGGKSPWDAFEVYLLSANMPDLINLETREVKLNQKWFKDLLIKFKECSKSKNFVLGGAEFNLTNRLHDSLLAFTLINKGTYHADGLYHFNEYNKTNRSKMIPSFTGEKNNNIIGYSERIYSINNRSERKESAWKFLSFLLEEDIQFIASKDRTGIPVSKKGVDRMIADAIFMHRFSGSKIDEYNNAMLENSHKIDYLYHMGYLRLDISKPIGLYMDDKITLDEAIKKAEENVIIRLNE